MRTPKPKIQKLSKSQRRERRYSLYHDLKRRGEYPYWYTFTEYLRDYCGIRMSMNKKIKEKIERDRQRLKKEFEEEVQEDRFYYPGEEPEDAQQYDDIIPF